MISIEHTIIKHMHECILAKILPSLTHFVTTELKFVCFYDHIMIWCWNLMIIIRNSIGHRKCNVQCFRYFWKTGSTSQNFSVVKNFQKWNLPDFKFYLSMITNFFFLSYGAMVILGLCSMLFSIVYCSENRLKINITPYGDFFLFYLPRCNLKSGVTFFKSFLPQIVRYTSRFSWNNRNIECALHLRWPVDV